MYAKMSLLKLRVIEGEMMSYKVVVDSCCELPEDFRSTTNYEIVPLMIQVEDHHIVDDDTFDQKDLLDRMAASKQCPKSSCPSPEKYMDAYKDSADNIYVITLSAELSGSYNSAVLGKNLYLEENPHKNIYIFNSRTASGGESQIAFWVRQFEEAGLSFEEVVEKTEACISQLHTYFVLDSLEALRKNGRLSNIKALVANTLNIKPIMAGTRTGTIVQLGQARGIDKALKKMVEYTLSEVVDPEEKTLVISHCNCAKRAEEVLALYLEKQKFKNTRIMDTRGISSLYASDGGIIVTV